MEEFAKEKLVKIINKYSKKLKGVSFAITDKEKTIFEHYYGVMDELKTPNNPTTMMMIASNTKLLTTLGVMQLMEQGLVDLDEDIHKYIEELHVPSSFEYDKITVRQILMHRSGLVGDSYVLELDTSKTMADILIAANKINLITKPGTMYSYSNVGFSLLGTMIERLTGETYVDYIKKHILEPLDLSMKFLPMQEDRDKYKGILSECLDKKGKAQTDPLSAILSAGSNTYSTLEDMTKLTRLFLNPDDVTIISPSSLKMMLEMPSDEFYEQDEIRHGLGLMFNMPSYANSQIGPTVGHGGATFYHFSVLYFFPKLQIGIVCLTNTLNGNPIINKLAGEILIEYLKSINIEIPRLSVPKSPRITCDLQQYEETFVSLGMKMNFKVNAKGVLQSKIHGLKISLYPREDGYFEIKPKGIARLPIFGKSLKKNLLKIRSLNDEATVYFKSYAKNYLVLAPVMSVYRQPKSISQFSGISGTYERVNPIKYRDSFAKKIVVKIKNDVISANLKVEGVKRRLYFDIIDNNTLIIQGIGRETRELIQVIRDGNDILLKWSGLTYKKIK